MNLFKICPGVREKKYPLAWPFNGYIFGVSLILQFCSFKLTITKNKKINDFEMVTYIGIIKSVTKLFVSWLPY